MTAAGTRKDAISATAEDDIEWSRIVRPQADHYDTRMLYACARRRGFPDKSSGQERITICDGRVVVQRFSPEKICSDFTEAPLDHPNIEGALSWLRCVWPVVYQQFAELVHTFEPFYIDGPDTQDGPGCSSGGGFIEEPFGAVFCSIDRAYGCAEAMVHELAHLKLLCAGVHLQWADAIIANDPGESFVSVFRTDKLRPMQAIVHGHYAFLHVAQLALCAIDAAPEIAKRALTRDLPLLSISQSTIAEHIRTFPQHQDFVDGLVRWGVDVLDAGARAVRR